MSDHAAHGSGVTIVTPTYNRAEALRETLPVMLAIEGVDEILIIDDASTDGTREMLAAIDDPRLRVLRQPANAGQQAARNRGMAESRGEWILFGEDDVLMPVDYVETLLRVADQQDAQIVGSPWLLVEGNDLETAIEAARARAIERPGLDTVSAFPKEIVETPFLPAIALVSRAVAEQISFDEGYGGNAFREESDFFVAAARAGFKVVMTPETYSYQFKTWGGGAHSMRLGYELWSVRNTTRFVRRHGRWLKSKHLIEHPWLFNARFARSRAGHVLEHYLRQIGGRAKRIMRRN